MRNIFFPHYLSGEPLFVCLMKIKNPDLEMKSGFCLLRVVPPGIVIYTQVALYLHFEELPNPQSPPIAPPQNCVVLRIVKADDFVWQRYNFRVRNRKD